MLENPTNNVQELGHEQGVVLEYLHVIGIIFVDSGDLFTPRHCIIHGVDLQRGFTFT